VSRYWFIAAEKATYPVSLLCRVLDVSRASFYAWLQRGPSARAQADQQLLRQISKIHRASRGTYGAPRVHAELRDDYGVRASRKRVARLMRTAGLVGCHRRRRRGLTRPDPAATPAPDLVGRLFDPGAPDRTWFADISYIPTEQGWLYLAAVLDGCSRRVVGWPWPTISAPNWPWTPSRWRGNDASPRGGSSVTATAAASTPPASTPGPWRLPGSARAWGGWRPVSTTPPARASSRP
jgi:hypothetical protein